MKPSVVEWTCPDCGNENTITVAPLIPAKISGPPESCYPAEGGEIDPEECSKCGRKIDDRDLTSIYDQLESREDARLAALEDKWDSQRENPKD